jgi:hypothetical protein
MSGGEKKQWKLSQRRQFIVHGGCLRGEAETMGGWMCDCREEAIGGPE